METDEYKTLQEIVGISKNVIEGFGGRFQRTDFQHAVARSAEFERIMIDLDRFEQSFRHLPISEDLASRIYGIFKDESSKLKIFCESELLKFKYRFKELGGSDRNLLKYNHTLKLRFKMEVERLHNGILSAVKANIERFHQDAAATDAESASESDSVHKGHSPFAVAILEKVFSKQTNISRAEKYQLAVATKLEPRQVTIWFQNRRNRNRNIVNSELKAETSTPKGKKRKYDGMEEEPRTPTQRRRLSQNELMSSSASTVFTYGTPLSISSSADASVTSNDSDLFEQQQVDTSIESIDSDFFDKQPTSGLRCISGSSMTTSYDDGSCVFEGSTFGNTSFDDHLQKLASSDDLKYNKESDMIFNKDGQVMLDMEDLEIDLSTFGAGFSQMRFPAIDFTLTTPSAYETAPRNATQFQLSSEGMSEEEILMQYAKQMVEKDFNTQGELQRIEKEDHWQTGTLHKIFFGNDITNTISNNAEEMGLSEICSSQGSSQNGTSSSQASTPKSIFDFSLEGLGLDEILKHNKESIEEAESPMNTFTPMSQVTFNFPTPKMLCAPFSPTKTSST